ncbi:MAG: transglutaminase domain-containing protein [Clostridia bacterium]|nr:transglutaminase domain-containing protein [Clostridia bacterium]
MFGSECFRYYRSLTDTGIYDEIFECLASVNQKASVPRIGVERAVEIFREVLLDNPGIFYVDGISYSVRGDSIDLIPKYSFDKKEIAGISLSLKKRAERIAARLKGGTDPVSAVHDFLVSSVEYRFEKRRYSHEIYGVLHHGIGVCEGISKTAKLLLDMMGTESAVIVSEPMGNVSHAWNVVWTGGRPLHYDITFDLSHRADRRRYFGLTDAGIYLDHGKPLYPAPECN